MVLVFSSVLERTLASGSDTFANATVITNISAPVTGSNAGATGELGEPDHNQSSLPLNSVWWKWRAPFSGQMTITTEGSNFDTTLAVYTGSSLSSLVEVVSNDDIVSGIQRVSKVSFNASADIDYWIAVDGWWNETGEILLNLSLTPFSVPANDNFLSAIPVTRQTPFLLGHNGGSTAEMNEPNHAGDSLPLNSIWYSWQADISGSVTISSLGSDFDTVLAVYTGTNMASLTPVVANDEFWGHQSQVTFNVSKGTIYRVAVDGRMSSAGKVCLNFAFPELTSTNLPLGATVNKSGTNVTGVTFRVWAPNASAVSVRGQFNGWNETVMTKDPATDYWSVTESLARPGQEYKYFLRWAGNSNGTWKVDPRAVWILNGNGVIYDHGNFDWGNVTAPSIPVGRQVAYEMHVGTFNDPNPNDGRPGTFGDAIKRLDYLQRLGVNVIALMPINEFGGDRSWGYNPENVFAIESAYGGPEEFKKFVKAAHQRGMAVQVDLVHNHYNPSSDGLWEFDGPANVYFYAGDRASTDWGPRPDFDRPEVQRFIRDHAKLLLERFRVDGFRWDSPENILGYQASGVYQVLPAGKSLMASIHQMIRAEFPGTWSVAETVNLLKVRATPDGDLLSVPNAADSFHGHWNYGFYYDVINGFTQTPSDLSRFTNNLTSWSDGPGYRVIFSDNHDKAGGQHNIEKGIPALRLASRIDSNNPLGLTARKKSLLSGVLTLTTPGVPMLFMGQEFQASGMFADTNPVIWTQASQQHEIFRGYRDLLALRSEFPALQNLDASATECFFDQVQGLLTCLRRGTDPAGDVLLLMNFSDQAKTNLSASFPSSGPWYVRYNSDWKIYGVDFQDFGVAGNQLVVGGTLQGTVSLAPWGAILLAKTSAISAVNVTDADGDGLPDSWEAFYGVSDFGGDNDGDGISNLREYQLGFDPTTPNPTYAVGDFNQWNPTASAMKTTPNANTLLFLMITKTNAPAQEMKFLSVGEWYGTSTSPGFASANNPGSNIPYSSFSRGYLAFTFNTETKVYSVSSFTPFSEVVDAYGDGMDDRWEQWYGVNDPGADPDADGFSNLQEFRRGSDPNQRNQASLALAGGFNNWTAGANPMTYVWSNQWQIDLPFAGGSVGQFKFTDGTWSNDWGDSAPVDGVADFKTTNNIQITFANGVGIYRFQIDEGSLAYEANYVTGDANGDGVQDAWVAYYGLTGADASAIADPDGDGINNFGEFRRLSSPLVSDRMTITGSTSPMPFWNSAANNMVWSDARQRWEWSGNFGSGLLEFKFVQGTNWYGTGVGVAVNTASTSGGANLSTNLTAGRYRFSFSETNGGYALQSFPVSTEWREVNGLPAVGAWTNDTDRDGITDLVEYALGGSPTNNADGRSLQTMMTTNAGGTNRLVLQWLQRTDGGGSLVITPEMAADLTGTWNSLTPSNVANKAGDPVNHQRKEASVPQDTSKKFLRLRVTGP